MSSREAVDCLMLVLIATGFPHLDTRGAPIRCGFRLSQACRMKVGEILRKLNEDGWVLVATRGSHRQYRHPSKAGRVTVAGKPGDDLAAGTLNSILKQSGLKR